LIVPTATTTTFDRSTDLLERSHHLAALRQSLAAVRSTSRGRLLLVGGEAGVGKTALIRQFCDEQRRSVRILWGACDALFTPAPLGPLLDIAEPGGELEALVESGAKPHEVAAMLVRELRTRPTVFVLEDVHWADEATLDVLRLLGRRAETVPALIVASYRDDELDRAHPLRIVIGELAANAAIGRLKIAPLSPVGVAALAEPHGIDADDLFRKTAGNPFFVTEVLAAGEAEIPPTVQDAVLARAARLTRAARSLLEAVAVVSPKGEVWLLETIAADAIERLDECVGSGVLIADAEGVRFRHELARLAVEGSVALNRRVALHRKALAALADPPTGEPDLARLAHHAEAAGDADAVLRFAPAAAARAASLGAHRESAAQYARALRFGDRLSAAERANLLERRSRECYLTDQYDDGIAALEQALECRRALGDRVGEAEAHRRLSEFLWCPGRTAEAERAARDAVTLLERLPPGRELVRAYHNLGRLCGAAARSEEAIAWGGRALELAEQLEDAEGAAHALTLVSSVQGDYEQLEQSLERARRGGLAEQVGHISILLAAAAVESRRHPRASRYLEAGIVHCSEQGLELFRLYLHAHRARSELDQGRWSDAADSAASVLRVPRTSTTPRILSLVVLALVRARRGDPQVWPLLDEAWKLAEPTGELPRLAPVAAARAEAAWLEGRHGTIADATGATLDLALRRSASWRIGELACWRRRAGIREEIAAGAAEPYARQLAGEWARAAEEWSGLGCPYEAALALADSEDDDALRRALRELQRLGAAPAAALVARRLRQRGARGLPRGPRPATRKNPANLTARQLEVLALIARGLRNAEIAERLFLAEKTVDHHVSAILRKLGVRTRGQASIEAARLGVVAQDR